jgi:hypothetical protein
MEQKAMLKRIKRSAFMIGILTTITVLVYIFGKIQRIELEEENASLKQQIQDRHISNSIHYAEAQKNHDEMMARIDSIKNANK